MWNVDLSDCALVSTPTDKLDGTSTTEILIRNSTLVNITRKMGDGAGLQVTRGRGQRLNILGGSVTGVSENDDGGGMHVILVDSGELTVGTDGQSGTSEIAVTHCRAPAPALGLLTNNGRTDALGSGIFVDVAGTSQYNFNFTGVNFSLNTAWKGRNIYLFAPDPEAAVQLPKFNFQFAPKEERDGSLSVRLNG
jgi:hypothetical protein